MSTAVVNKNFGDFIRTNSLRKFKNPDETGTFLCCERDIVLRPFTQTFQVRCSLIVILFSLFANLLNSFSVLMFSHKVTDYVIIFSV